MSLLHALIGARLAGGSGGEVTATDVVKATGRMTAQQAATTLTNLGAEAAPGTVTDLTSTSITLAPAANTLYTYGTLSALTLSSAPAGWFNIVFTSGSTATVTTFPAGISGLESFAAKANTQYELDVRDGRATIKGWPVGASA